MATRGSSLCEARWLLLLALLVTSAQAHAAAPDDAAKERARELMAAGRKARANADLAAALESFREADDIMHVPTTALELAKALRDLGRLAAAAEVLARLEALPEAPAEPEVFSTARRAAQDMKLELDARIPSLRVTSSPAARLTVDGKPVEAEQAAIGLRVDAGRHVVTAERHGAVQERVVQLAESGSAEVAFEFAEPRASTPPAPVRPATTPTSTYVIYGLTGLAVAGIGTGVGLTLWSNGRKGALERGCAPRCGAEEVADLRAGYVAANVTTAVGIGSGLAALTLYLLRDDRRPPRRDSAHLSLSASTGPGVTLAGRF